MKRSLQLLLFVLLLSPAAMMAQVSFTASTTSGCVPLTVTFTNTSTVGNYYEWVFFDGTPTQTSVNATHTFYNTMNHPVSLTAYDTTGGGMVNLGTYYIPGGISVNGSNLSITADTACPGETIVMYLYPYGNNISWNFGDGNTSTMTEPEHAYAVPGTYTITVTANTSCGTQTITKQVVIMNNAIPSARFNMRSPVCPNEPASFYPRNFAAASYSWTFGDGGTSTMDRPQHTYASPGNYPVTLTITSTCGTTATRTDTIRVVNNLPVGNMIQIYSSTMSACPGDPISFDYNMDEMFIQKWMFGTGDSSLVKNPVYAFDTAGTYNVSLYLQNGCGNDTTIYTTITIGTGMPFSGFAGMDIFPSEACPGDPIQFMGSPANSYAWTFGDGGTSTDANTMHSYSALGNYPVTLTLTNGCGSDTTISDTVSITNTLVPYLSHSGNNGNWGTPAGGGCPGDTIIFYTFGGASYLWDFGDGTTATQTEQISVQNGNGGVMIVDIVKHAFDTLGTYTVSLTYTNGCGNSATDSLEFTIGGNSPVQGGMTLTSSNLTFCDTIGFLAFGGSTYLWRFGDGDTLATTQSGVEHLYAAAGSYNVEVEITNNCGNTATYSETITIGTCTPIGAKEYVKNADVKLYPNPFNSSATLSVGNVDGSVSLEVYDLVGKSVMQKKITSNNTVIDRGELNNGLYIYNVKSEGRVIATGKMIIE